MFDDDRLSLAQAIRQGSIAALKPTLGFEVRTTNTTRGGRGHPRMCTMYLRFNPEGVE